MYTSVLLIKMSSRSRKKLKRRHVGALPLIEYIVDQMELRDVLHSYIETSGREAIDSVDVLMMLVVNMTIAKDPLYELAQWVDSLDLRALGYARGPRARFTDDRCARALDKLYEADVSSLMTRLVVGVIRAFDLQLDRIHNDSTSVKAFGRIPGRTRNGLQLLRGFSKDHRPDLKQLVYSLSVTADGAVPIHHKIYSGNRNDDTTHIETWDALRNLHGCSDFLYVADCKLCSQEQLSHIVDNKGNAITIVPQGFTEVREFKEQLREGLKPKKLLWRRPKPMKKTETEYFYLFEGCHRSRHGYPLYWFSSSEKRLRDRRSRNDRLRVAEAALAELAPKLNARRLKRRPDILRAAAEILKHYGVQNFINVRLQQHVTCSRKRKRGRPAKGERVEYERHRHVSYSLHWSRDAETLRREARVDGLFPLLCTDPDLQPKDVLKAYKYQPRLEKRFEQLKSVHRAAPMLFKKVERVEASMSLFFIALIIQALLERLLRHRLVQRKGKPLNLYPEDRAAPHPTTSQLFKTFDSLYTYEITQDDRTIEEYRDELSETHRRVLDILDISEQDFWHVS